TAAGALALQQLVDVEAAVDAAAMVGTRARLQQSAADVGVQGRGTDAEQPAGVGRGDEFVLHGDILIDCIKIDQYMPGWHSAPTLRAFLPDRRQFRRGRSAMP